VSQANEIYTHLITSIATAINGQEGSMRLILAALAGGGHVLLEDYPGTGKTTLS